MFKSLNAIRLGLTLALSVTFALVGCGGGGGGGGAITPTPSYTVSGITSGLSGTGLVLQNNTAGDLVVAANGTFTFANSLAASAAYSVTVKTQPSAPAQTCTVSNGSGTISGANISNVTVTCVLKQQFAYVINHSSNDVSAYAINAVSGALTSLGTPVSVGPTPPIAANGPTGLTVTPSGKFAYVVTTGSGGSVVVYDINATTGALTGLRTVIATVSDPLVMGNPVVIAVDPTGKFAYVTYSRTNNIYAYALDATTGALTSVGTPLVGGVAPFAITIDSAGKFLYTANGNSDSVSAYAINAATGVLTGVGTVATGNRPMSIRIGPTGKFAYVVNDGSNNVSVFAINATTGELTSVGTVATGVSPATIAIDPTGKFAYVTNSTDNTVSAYVISNTTGMFTSAGAVATGTVPNGVTVDSTGKFLYVANYSSNDVSVYTIDAITGAPTSTGTVAAGTMPYVVVTTQ